MDPQPSAMLRSSKGIKSPTSIDKRSKKNDSKALATPKLTDHVAETSNVQSISESMETVERAVDGDQLLGAADVDQIATVPEKSHRDETPVLPRHINADKLDIRRFSQRLIKSVNGTDVNMSLLQSDGFACPLVVLDKSGLGMRLPSETFSLVDIKKCVGSRRIIQAVDTHSGQSENMSMKTFLRYYEDQSQRLRVLSINNLVLSQTKLSTHIEPPEVVRRTDWANLAFSAAGYNHFVEGAAPEYMKLQRLCDISTAGSFTDFHIDAGGATRWYHIFRGSKIIWMVPPTADNYNQYLDWLMNTSRPAAQIYCDERGSAQQLQYESVTNRGLFYADRVQNCQALSLNVGSTLFIPAGWIYALYSLEDSICFSGSFLHSFNVSTQLRVAQLENQVEMPLMLRYPLFTDLHWYVLEAYVRCLTGVRHLVVTVKQELYEEHLKDGNLELKQEYGNQGLKQEDGNQDLKQDENQQLKHEHNQELKPGGNEEGKQEGIKELKMEEKDFERLSSCAEVKNLYDEQKPNSYGDGRPVVEVKSDEGVASNIANIEPLLVDIVKANENLLTDVTLVDYNRQDLTNTSAVTVEGISDVLESGQDGSFGVWVHISSFEREGIDSVIDFLESNGTESAPKDIEDACGLIKQAKLMLAAHSNDDAKLSITGQPILSTIDKKKEKIKLKQHITIHQPSTLSPSLSSLPPSGSSLSPSQSTTVSMGRKIDANARRRRVRCKKCERCTSTECGDCAYCQDMKKFGGMGRLKQTCIGRQCIAPILPTAAVCCFCKKGEAELGSPGVSPTDMLMECGICWKISHPACLKLAYPELTTEGVVNEDLPSSWECPLCCVQGKRGQLKPRVAKGQGQSRPREEEGVEEDDGHSSSVESNLAEDDVLHSQAKNKNKSLQENKTLLNICETEQIIKTIDESPSGSQNQVRPETQWTDESSPQQSLLGSIPVDSKTSLESVVVTPTPLSPNRFTSSGGMYVVRPLPCAPPPKHVSTTSGQSHMLDRELWLRVFTWLTPRELSACMGVCKVWNRWAFDHRLWRRINLARKQIRQTHLIGIVRRQPKSLDLSMTNVSERQLSWLLARLPHLKELDLSSNSWAAVSSLCSSAACPPSLTKLNLSWVSGLGDSALIELVSPPASYGVAVRPGVQDSSVSRLRYCSKLYLTGTDITDTSLAVCARYLTRLESVDLRLCVSITDCGVRALCSSAGDRLTELVLSGCVLITGVGLESVSRLCPNLKRLSMVRCTKISDEQKSEFSRRHINCIAVF